MRLLKFLAGPVLVCGSLTASAQQTYTQFSTNITPFNSNYSLISEGGSVDVLGRKQWVGIEGAPSALNATAYLPLSSIKAAAGLIVIHDKFAVENLTESSVFIAKAVQLSDESFLSASFSAGIRSYKANYSQLDPSDVKFQDNIINNTGTLGLSVMYYNPDKFYLGASLPRLDIRNLGKASVEENRHQSSAYYFNAAYLFDFGDYFKLKPAAMIAYARNIPSQFSFSTMMYLDKSLGLGANYANSGEVGGILSYLFNNNLSFGYSYQIGVGSNTVSIAGRGTHEVTMGYRFGSGLVGRFL